MQYKVFDNIKRIIQIQPGASMINLNYLSEFPWIVSFGVVALRCQSLMHQPAFPLKSSTHGAKLSIYASLIKRLKIACSVYLIKYSDSARIVSML